MKKLPLWKRIQFPLAVAAFLTLSWFLVFQIGIATEYAERLQQQNAQQHAKPAQAEENKFYAFWQWTTHDPVAFYTSVLAVFTFVLSTSTIGLWWVTWRSGIRQASDMEATIVAAQAGAHAAEISAHAAVKSSEAAVAAEQARFFLVIEGHNVGEVLYRVENQHRSSMVLSIVGPETPPTIKYRFKNYGKTPGIIREISLGMKLAREPFDPVYSIDFRAFRESMIAAQDASHPEEFSFGRPLTVQEAGAIANNVEHLWFFGRVAYEDVFGNPHTHRFYIRTVVLDGDCILQSYDYKHYNQST